MDPRYLGFVEKVDYLLAQLKQLLGRVGTLETSAKSGVTYGSAILVAGTVTVLSSVVKAGDNIQLTMNLFGGGSKGIYLVPQASIIPGVSFVINSLNPDGSANSADTSTINWLIPHI